MKALVVAFKPRFSFCARDYDYWDQVLRSVSKQYFCGRFDEKLLGILLCC